MSTIERRRSELKINNKMNDAAVTGMFIFEGICDVGYGECIDAWRGSSRGEGCIEFVEEVATHVPFIISERDRVAAQNSNEFPGVFEYEVVASFGNWYANTLLNQCDVPSADRCRELITSSVEGFFAQGRNGLPERTP